MATGTVKWFSDDKGFGFLSLPTRSVRTSSSTTPGSPATASSRSPREPRSSTTPRPATRAQRPSTYARSAKKPHRRTRRRRPLCAITEVHMVGGLHPTLKKDWILACTRAPLDPELHIKAFTAIEM